ncbi:MAG: uncharacterized protein K0Q43_5009 [Ramlibacter sp.]|nr:uncharacterized protein [Ramlibacter sp.]
MTALMFSDDLIAQLAAELHESEKSRVQIEHFSKRFPGMTVEDGYAISRAWVAMKIAQGRKARGHKIGLTSRAMQIASQIDEPDYGTLLDDMFFEPGDIPAARFIAPRVEVELAFVLKHKLEGERVTVEQVLQATEYVTRWTCPGAARSCARTAPSRKRAWPPACRATQRSASPGWR